MSIPGQVMSPYEALQIYEKVIYRRQPDSNQALFTVVNSLMMAGTTSGLMSPDAPVEVLRALYTRFAAAITTQLLAPGFGLTNVDFYKLCNNKIVIEAAFALSGFADAQHLLDYLIETDAEGHTVLRESTVFLTCIFFSLDNIPDPVFDAALNLHPDILLPLMIGWLSTHRVLTLEGEARRGRLLEAHERIATASLPIELLRAASHAWMYCTYSESESRHEVKRTLNKLMANLALSQGAKPKSVARRIVTRPRLLVAAERWRSNHAMYRCYLPWIRQLKEHFHTILVADVTEYDEKSAAIFDEVVGIQQQGITLPAALAAIISQKPDIVYYPSLGMSPWTLITACFRLAPIQFMTAGHPATSMSEHIDYMLFGQRGAEAADSCNETFVLLKGDPPFEPHPELADEIETQPLDDGALHVAVHASSMKLSARFLQTCKRLISEAGRRLHFHFYPGAMGVGMDDLRMRLPELLSGATVTVHPYLPYMVLVRSVAHCDLALSPFPFGNTNSTIDTCLAGVPTVGFRAPYMHCLGDKTVMQAAGIPEWLLTTNYDEYHDVALRLIRDEQLRIHVREDMRAIDMRSRLFTLPDEGDAEDFAESVWWIYQNHERIRKSQKHCLTRGDPLPE